ncbi:uncharacterized protein LOC132840693 isoform X2 [Tachysurus vachellii]|uniref:uncharacterized protein LOC132840693 isoform X2 n=1 Tax=Tachysurus vachellii TaxID=175792 RepID=UPI00296B417D|nr:uncharacterized protein LOC132840693 isoform X2 [Tachysurus vachellii]
MGTALKMYFYLLLLVFICDGFNVHGPPGPPIVQLGDSVMLPCFVKTPIPLEELEVEWKRIDSETLVHLWQDGESRPESQNHHYYERANFFTEEIAHGNFSLLLTNVTRKDVGVYKCTVYTKLDSGETLIEIKEIERLIVSGAHIMSAYAGEDITLNCSVDSHITPEKIEEVSWKKTDEDILVLLYQEGEILTESTGERYVDRVEFFSDEERKKGNFSLRLKDVRTEDKGLYMCLVFSGELSANTTVEVQQLGLSFLHIAIFILCILGFVIGSLILGFLSYTSYKKEDDSRRALGVQCAHVLIPNITMSIVFIIWGVTEGFFTEAATCSALNFVRSLFLLWIALHLKTFQDFPCRLINHFPILLQYTVITGVAYSRIFVDIFDRGHTIYKVFLLLSPSFLLLALIKEIGYCRKILPAGYSAIELSNTLRMVVITIRYGLHQINLAAAIFTLFFPTLQLFWISFCNIPKRWNYLFWVSVMFILEVLSTSGSIYLHYDAIIDMKERDALVCVTAFLHILTLITLFRHLNYLPAQQSESRNRGTQRSHQSESRNTGTQRSHLVVFMFGTVGVVFLNAVVLSVELILKARNGERTVDLRLILLPTESVFAVCYLTLQISAFYCHGLSFTKGRRKEKDLEKTWRICDSFVCVYRDRGIHLHNVMNMNCRIWLLFLSPQGLSRMVNPEFWLLSFSSWYNEETHQSAPEHQIGRSHTSLKMT